MKVQTIVDLTGSEHVIVLNQICYVSKINDGGQAIHFTNGDIIKTKAMISF